MKGGAETAAQKRAVIEKILAAWERMPESRLAQLITNAVTTGKPPGSFVGRTDSNGFVSVECRDIFYVEDEDMASCIDAYAAGRK